MSILESKIYQEDLKRSIYSINGIEKLKGSKILITGASGLVCSAIIDLLFTSNLDIKIYAAGRNKSKMMKRFGECINFVLYDATKEINFNMDVDYIIHGASNASPNLYVNEPVETMQANICGMKNLLDYARNKNTKKILYISSSEVYGKKQSMEPFKEEQYGFIDLLDPRSSYSIGKRAAETMCSSYYSEYGVDFNVVRLGHIYGPSATNVDKRVSSDLAFKAAKGENLVLKSEGKQKRSYCYSLDCASAILTVLINGNSGEAYNISNSESVISIREMAEYLARAGEVKLLFDIPTQAEAAAFNPMDNSSLNSTKLEGLGWKGNFKAEEGLSHTVRILRGE